MSLVDEYFLLSMKYRTEYGSKTILLMQVGSFFEVYGNKEKDIDYGINDFARICDLNIATKQNNTLMAGFKDMMLEKYLKKIHEAGFTAVVYTQHTNDGITFERKLAGIYSPGTYFQTETNKLTNVIACVWIEHCNPTIVKNKPVIMVGMSSVDIFTGKTNVFQYEETYMNSPTTYDNLERFISIYSPMETILISNLNKKNLKEIIHYANINSASIHLFSSLDKDLHPNVSKSIVNCEKQTYQTEILKKYYKIVSNQQLFEENVIATQSFCYLLDFIYQHNPHLVTKLSEPVFEQTFTKLHLANHSLKQLNIIEDGTFIGSNKKSSVLGLLNQCITSMGKRQFADVLLNPTFDINWLQKEYDMVDYFKNEIVKNQSERENIYNLLSNINDLSKIHRTIFLKKFSPNCLLSMYTSLNNIKQINSLLIKNKPFSIYFEETNGTNVENISLMITEIIDFIDNNINIKSIDKGFEVNFFKENVSEELDQCLKSLTQSETNLKYICSYLNEKISVSENKKGEFIKIYETENSIGLTLTQRRSKILESALLSNEIISLKNGNTMDVSKKLFNFVKQTSVNNLIHHPELTILCETYITSKKKVKECIINTFNKFVVDLEKYGNNLLNIISYVTSVDILFCKAIISIKYNYCKPQIDSSTNESYVEAFGIRHCLIEQFEMNELYVTNDVCLRENGILLYGTNAVGKTTLIRAIGISVIMAQAGLFVPCTKFVFNPYKTIFTRIIGNDNIFKGLSTFEVEMLELRTILNNSNQNSLILGDELCSGTENISAISIFVAGIQKLVEIKSSFIFATHLHEIVNYDEIVSLKNSLFIKHMEVIYNSQLGILVYDRKLKDGPGNNLYGLEVCKSLHLPKDFLFNANSIRQKYFSDNSSILQCKTSRYNSNKLINKCEFCNLEIATETHHLFYQSNSDENGFIKDDGLGLAFDKNSKANLMSICDSCHKKIHLENNTLKYYKTTDGYKYFIINKN